MARDFRDDALGVLEEGSFTLELLHFADQEAGAAATQDAPRLSAVLNALRAQDLGDDGLTDNTLTLSSGDAYIPGLFFNASEPVFGSRGIADIQIQNELGVQAIALGNHEFDFGPEVLADLISGAAPGEVLGEDFAGLQVPYLSTNLDFSSEPSLAPLEVPSGQAPQANSVTGSVVIDVNGEPIGVVGATTPTLQSISSPGGVGVQPSGFGGNPTDDNLDALAAEIQGGVDELLDANPGMNKVVLLAHMQQISIEQELATRLSDVDIIVAGGSNTRLFDEDDQIRDGDSRQGDYPINLVDADGNPVALVNTDGSYKYVGRLAIDFDENGNIVPASYDPAVSGAYPTDLAGVAELGAEGMADPEIQRISDAIQAQIVATESNVFGISDVFLNGNRAGTDDPADPDGVRTQETNLGNLTADANLAIANGLAAERGETEDVVLSIKNGGGIRASIGQTLVPAGETEAVRLANEGIDGVKPAGGISQNDIETALAFNNGLTLLTLTKTEIVALLEHGVSALPDVAGQFPQVSGVEFSYDSDRAPGTRIEDAAIVDADGDVIAPLVQDGEIVGDGQETFRITTLNFLATPSFDGEGNFIGGGDGYPFPNLNTDPSAGEVGDPGVIERVNAVQLTEADEAPRDGEATFAADGSEQDALAEYLADNHATEETAFSEADAGRIEDARIQNLGYREGTVFDEAPVEEPAILLNEVLGSTTGADSEYVELTGPAGASLAGLSLVAIESDQQADNGAIEFRFDFADDAVLGENGYYLVANGQAAQTYGISPDALIDANSIENSNYTMALVETASLSGDAVTGDEVVLDAVGVTETDDQGFAFGAPVVGPDGAFLPAGVGRIERGVDTDSASDFEILSFNNETPPNTPTAAGSLGDGDGNGNEEGSIDDEPTLVSEIQGSGEASGRIGETVVVEGIVTGDFQNGDADDFRNLGGFFLMEEAGDRDGDDSTSEGIFAYEGSGDLVSDVAAGDRVRILGEVVERFGKTSIDVSEIRVEEAGAVADVGTIAVSKELPGTAGREALESMLVDFSEPLTFVESFDYENFNEGTMAAGGPILQYTQINDPDVVGNEAYLEEVADRTITIDDGTNSARDNGDPIPQPDGNLFEVEGGIRMGQDFDLTAVMDYDFGAYRLRLPEGSEFEPIEGRGERPEEPADVGGSFKVASLNVLNYFTTLDGQTDIGQGPRGAENEAEFERQSQKLVTAIATMDADVLALNEIENDFAGDTFAIQELVDRLNAEVEGDPWAFVDPGREFVGSDAIAVGFIYNSETTELVGDAAILDDPSFLDPLDDQDPSNGDETPNGDAFNRAAVAQTFREVASGGEFTAVANHLKSKGSLTGNPADADLGDGAGANDATRAAAVEELIEWLASDPTGSGDRDAMILGDLNSYAQESPIRVLEESGFTNLVAEYEGAESTSYRFSGQVGTLDYALANDSLSGQTTGATVWDINAEEPVFYDYNRDGTYVGTERPADQGLFEGDNPARNSDHDPVIVGLDLEGPVGEVVSGGPGRDSLAGTTAAETVIGGGGLDVVLGGGGGDTFVFVDTEGRDTLRIGDYSEGEDLLDLAGTAIAQSRSIGDLLVLSLDSDEGDTIILDRVESVSDLGFVDEMAFV